MSRLNNSDKLLLAIVLGIIVLVIIAFVVIARRPQPQFQSLDTPEAVVHDYLLALQLGDYERAYGFLSPEIAYPGDIDEFYDSLRLRPWEIEMSDNTSLVVESSQPVSGQSVAVVVRQIYNNNTLFGGDSYSDTFRMRVENDGQGWKLASGERFWSSCWGEENKCEAELQGID
jgi:hypothetical protein